MRLSKVTCFSSFLLPLTSFSIGECVRRQMMISLVYDEMDIM